MVLYVKQADRERIFATVSACGLNFRSFGPQLDPDFSAALWTLQYALQR